MISKNTYFAPLKSVLTVVFGVFRAFQNEFMLVHRFEHQRFRTRERCDDVGELEHAQLTCLKIFHVQLQFKTNVKTRADIGNRVVKSIKIKYFKLQQLLKVQVLVGTVQPHTGRRKQLLWQLKIQPQRLTL